ELVGAQEVEHRLQPHQSEQRQGRAVQGRARHGGVDPFGEGGVEEVADEQGEEQTQRAGDADGHHADQQARAVGAGVREQAPQVTDVVAGDAAPVPAGRVACGRIALGTPGSEHAPGYTGPSPGAGSRALPFPGGGRLPGGGVRSRRLDGGSMSTDRPPTPPSTPLWRPSPERADATRLEAFRRHAERVTGTSLPDYDALHAWSVREPDRFWLELAAFLRIPFTTVAPH